MRAPTALSRSHRALLPRDTLAPLLVGGVLILVLIAVGTRSGAEVTPDGEVYLDVATDIRDGRWFADPPGSLPETHFPPGLPLLLAAGSTIPGLSPTGTAVVANTLAWLATLAGTLALYRATGGHAGDWQWLVALGVAGSAAITAVGIAVLTDVVFVAACVWFLVALERHCWRRSAGTLAGLVGLGVVALSLRYLGIALIAAGALRLLQQTTWPWVRRWWSASLVGAAALPVVVWFLAHAGDEGADRPGEPFTTSLVDVSDTVAAFGGWFLAGYPPSRGEDRYVNQWVDALAQTAMIVTALVVVGVAVALVARAARAPDGRLSVGRVAERLRARQALGAFDFVALYTIAVVGWRLLNGFHVLLRYWIPVAGVVFAVVGAALSRCRLDADQAADLFARLALVALALVVVSNLAHSLWLVA